MRAPDVIEADPVANDSAGMMQCVEPVPVHALFLQGVNQAFDDVILLRAVRHDELLLPTIAVSQSRMATADENQAIV